MIFDNGILNVDYHYIHVYKLINKEKMAFSMYFGTKLDILTVWENDKVNLV